MHSCEPQSLKALPVTPISFPRSFAPSSDLQTVPEMPAHASVGAIRRCLHLSAYARPPAGSGAEESKLSVFRISDEKARLYSGYRGLEMDVDQDGAWDLVRVSEEREAIFAGWCYDILISPPLHCTCEALLMAALGLGLLLLGCETRLVKQANTVL